MSRRRRCTIRRPRSVAGGDSIPPAAFDEGAQVITDNTNRVENPKVPQLALVAQLVDRRGAYPEDLGHLADSKELAPAAHHDSQLGPTGRHPSSSVARSLKYR